MADQNNSDNAVDSTRATKTAKRSKKKVAKTKKKSTRTKHQRKQRRVERPYPRATLEDAIKIPLAIRTKNGGNPWDPSSIASALNTGKGDSFYYLTAASRDFGLTTGTRETSEISLTELGRRLAYAETPEDEKSTRLEAFQNIDLFNRVLEYYNGSNLPEMKYLKNTLENKFNLAPETHEEFADLFRKNCEYLKITEGGSAPCPSNYVTSTTSTNSNDYVTVAEPESKSALTCFVAMPFSEKTKTYNEGFFSEVLKQIIAPAGRAAGFRVITAKKRGSDIIHATIINELLDADLVIADLTEHNPNVLFELGMRMANDKPVALIRATGTTPIFDVDNMLRVEEYNPCLWPSTVEKDLPKITEHIQEAWKDKDNAQTYLKILRSKIQSK